MQRRVSSLHFSYGRFYQSVPLDLGDQLLNALTSVSYRRNARNCSDPKDPRTCSIIAGGAGGRTYQFIGGTGIPVDPEVKAPSSDELEAGARYQVVRDLTVALEYLHRSLGQSLGYGSGCCILGSLGLPAPRRDYDGGTLAISKPFSSNTLLSASYTLSSLRGNYPALLQSGSGLRPVSVTSNYDFFQAGPSASAGSTDFNRTGRLPADSRSSFKLDGAYLLPITERFNLSAGAALRAAQGTATNALGDSFGTQSTFILPRGSGGQLPWVWQLDLRFGATERLGASYQLGVQLDLFNVTNNQAVTAVDENYTFDAVLPILNGKLSDLAFLKSTSGAAATPNRTFGMPIAFQLPLSARLGGKLSF